MTQTKTDAFVSNYWDYYLELEAQFSGTKKYVAFDQANNKTFSIEYLKLIQAVCSEIDVVAKEIACYYEPTLRAEKTINIQKWGFVLQNNLPKLENATVTFKGNWEISPWSNWKYTQYLRRGKVAYKLEAGKTTPFWWTSYNAIKHNRMSIDENGDLNFHKANLWTTLNCLAALLILEWLFINVLVADTGDLASNLEYSQLFNTYKMDIS